ncbi:hypothetical protein [Streptomyces sp. NPDC101149]|uniref:hypothetical protein n=1 Tax=Streptomyces sp. NPDC101149 TaxID=3366113 RepID=UPI0038151518
MNEKAPSRLELLRFARRVVVQQATALTQIDGWIAEEEQQEAELRRGVEMRPRPPEWLIERGLNKANLMAVHVGDPGRSVTRDDLIAMLHEQTPACEPARNALIAGADFIVRDGLVPANRHAGVFRIRMRHSLKRGHTIDGLADSVDILLRAGEEPLRTGSIDAVDSSSWLTIFLNSTATVVVACYGGRRPTTMSAGHARWHQVDTPLATNHKLSVFLAPVR